MILKQKKYGVPDMLLMSLKTSPFYCFVIALRAISLAIIPTFSIFITASFINNAIAVYNKEAEISAIYPSVALLVGIMVYKNIVYSAYTIIHQRRQIYFRRKLMPEMLEKRANLAYRHIEDPKTADLINRVCPSDLWAWPGKVWDMYQSNILANVSTIVYIIGILTTITTQVWWLGLSMLAASVPIVLIATKAGRESYDADREMSKINRRIDYLSGVMTNREAVEERSVYGSTGSLNKEYGEKFEYARKFKLKIDRKNFIKQKMGGVVTSVYSIGAMFALVSPVVNGRITIGMFIGLMGAVFGLSQRLSWGINWQIQDFATKLEYLKDLTEFMKLEEHENAVAAPDRNSSFKIIEFKNVSFQYPDTDKLILDGISFTIENGRHYSFVGVNGAGKTTITKLLTGLYTNYDGEILVDGRSLRDLSQAEIKGLSSVVYQDFARYYISMYDNIAISDPENVNPNSPEQRKKIEKAAELMGLSDVVGKLKDGLDTPLGKILENGVDLSGGEWQRTAMARSIISKAPLKILDEPTAALDPIAESALYRNFEQISQGMTTLFISHRLGSTKLADVIYVLSDGKITERGSYAELMAQKGIYYEMFNAQAEWYRTDDETMKGFTQLT